MLVKYYQQKIDQKHIHSKNKTLKYISFKTVLLKILLNFELVKAITKIKSKLSSLPKEVFKLKYLGSAACFDGLSQKH